MELSCCIWALSGSEEEVLTKIANAGFRHIDLQPFVFIPEDIQPRIHHLNLQVSCLAASFGIPEGVALDSEDALSTDQALTYTQKALEYGKNLGANVAYLVPGADGSADALSRYAHSYTTLADQASALGIKLCIEHFPGSAFPTASATLNFIRGIDHPNLYLLLDIGHTQISNEDPAEVITSAGPKLGYVHLDDNDGQGDLHWSLTDGVQTENSLRQTFEALQKIQYNGPVSLELSAKLANPLEALIRSRELVLNIAPIS
jgi:sugar phosphate isomerase/epimerase